MATIHKLPSKTPDQPLSVLFCNAVHRAKELGLTEHEVRQMVATLYKSVVVKLG